MVGMATTFFRYFLFHVMASRFLSSSEDEIRQLLEEKDSKNTKRTYISRLTMYNKTIIGFGFCDVQKLSMSR